jgi:hypothetical protein
LPLWLQTKILKTNTWWRGWLVIASVVQFQAMD